LAHSVLERLDFAHAVSEPARALARAIDAAGASGSADLVRRLTPFVAGEYAQALGALDPRSIERELPFSLAVDAGGAKIMLKGQIDLLVERDGGFDVIDYKVTSPHGSDPTALYRFQLGAYTAAVRRREGDGAEVRSSIQFLDGKSRLPVLAAVPDLSKTLPALGEQLLEARRTGAYEGRPLETCRALSCGYVWLCHPSDDQAATR